MITSFEHDRNWIDILPSDFKWATENAYTVIVGKNGIGKSRLLSGLARPSSKDNFINYMGLNRVIAVSTSPFDKFPTSTKNEKSEHADFYRYVGMKRGFANTSAISLINSAARGLLLNTDLRGRNHRLIEVFKLLDLLPEVDFVFKLQPQTRLYDLSTELELGYSKNVQRYQYFEDDNLIDNEEKERAANALKELSNFLDHNNNFQLSYSVSDFELRLNSKDFSSWFIDEVLFLYEKNLIKLMDMRLYKQDVGKMSLRRASSGEQCILVSMLGIAGNIADYSLVLIDEPEISLHPEWQEKYIKLLINTFSHYQGCQFVIATHSPQIVANLPQGNCFVLSLATNQLHSAIEYSNKSSDYQLAELFKSPGASNEYLNRIALNIFAKVNKNKKFDVEDQNNFIKLNELADSLDQQGPLIELIHSLKLMRNYYAHD